MNAHLEGEIFVGSSKEGLGQALQVVTARSEVKDVKPCWFILGFLLGPAISAWPTSPGENRLPIPLSRQTGPVNMPMVAVRPMPP